MVFWCLIIIFDFFKMNFLLIRLFFFISDDAKLIQRPITIDGQVSLQSLLNKFHQWCGEWEVKVDLNGCTYMSFNPKLLLISNKTFINFF